MLSDCHSQGERLFSGGKFTEDSVGRADSHCDFFSTQTLVTDTGEFFAGDRQFFGQKRDYELVGQAGEQMLLHLYLLYFFHHTSCQGPLPVTVTTLLLFGHVTLLCGTFLYILLSEGPV